MNSIRAILIMFVALCMLGCREDLIHLSSELDANRVLFALRDAGVEASKKSIGKEWVVRIAQVDLTNALRVLEEKKIFQEGGESLAESNGNVFQSKEEKKNLRDKDLSKALSSSIRLIPFVKEARVHIYNSSYDPLAIDAKIDRSASVLIVHDEGQVSEDLVKELVSRGAGLPKEEVSVLFVLSEKRTEKLEATPSSKSEDLILAGQNFDWGNLKLKAKVMFLQNYAIFIILPFALLFLFGFKKMRARKKSLPRSRILNQLKAERSKDERA